MTRAIIVDLDGTLCNCTHREHHAQNRDWDAFHTGLADDKPHGDVAELVHTFAGAGFLMIGCTGRPERYRPATERWLMDHCIPLDFVLMRGNYDFEPDAVIKPRAVLEWHAHTTEAALMTAQERVMFVLDDRDRVVEAWREHGFNCWQVRHGGY